MDELREIILSHLAEMQSSGLSDERYTLYVDMVYQCESAEELLSMAALELQMEASSFLSELKANADELQDDSDGSFGDEGDDGNFGDEDLFELVPTALSNDNGDEDDGFSIQDSTEAFIGEEDGDDLFDASVLDEAFGGDSDEDGFGSENTEELTSFVQPAVSSGFEVDEDTAEQGTMETIDDPRLQALHDALTGNDVSEDDEDFYDIDALFAGGAPPVDTDTEHTVEYKDALAELLAEYPIIDEDDEDGFESIEDEAETPSGFGDGQQRADLSGLFGSNQDNKQQIGTQQNQGNILLTQPPIAPNNVHIPPVQFAMPRRAQQIPQTQQMQQATQPQQVQRIPQPQQMQQVPQVQQGQFGQPMQQVQHGQFGQPQYFGQPVKTPTPAGFGQAMPPAKPKPTVKQTGVTDVFSSFSKRKTVPVKPVSSKGDGGDE